MVCLYNVTGEPRPFPFRRLRDAGLTTPYDALGGHAVTAGADGVVWLPAYAAWWVVDGSA
jgi:amylosucrase